MKRRRLKLFQLRCARRGLHTVSMPIRKAAPLMAKNLILRHVSVSIARPPDAHLHHDGAVSSMFAGGDFSLTLYVDPATIVTETQLS